MGLFRKKLKEPIPPAPEKSALVKSDPAKLTPPDPIYESPFSEADAKTLAQVLSRYMKE